MLSEVWRGTSRQTVHHPFIRSVVVSLTRSLLVFHSCSAVRGSVHERWCEPNSACWYRTDDCLKGTKTGETQYSAACAIHSQEYFLPLFLSLSLRVFYFIFSVCAV